MIYKFQSTFPRGERLCAECERMEIDLFQSTFPRGERLHKLLKNPFKSVSIHVPTRGTTLVPFIVRLSTEFQSTFPRGERHRRMWERIINAMRFNPRSHEGNDMSSSSLLRFPFVSIHVPTRGTTQNGRKDNGNIQVSIHVPTRGTTYGMAGTA